MNVIKKPLDYMNEALILAKRARLTVSPNPMVGCIIVKDDQVISRGYHQRAGTPHAEIHALRDAREAANGADLYVTLEPCCHYHRTPPCTDAIIQAGIAKVYVACVDPNPQVAGKGIKILEAAGIPVTVGLAEKPAKELNKIFFHYMLQQKPFVIAKWAMSLDGKTVTHPIDSRNISSPQSRAMTHLTRQRVDAILVGAKTAVFDDPLLTVRTNKTAKHPIRIILSSDGNLPPNLKMFSQELPAKTIIATTNTSYSSPHKHVEALILRKNIEGRIDLNHLLIELGKQEITSLLVEGGMTTHESFIAEELVNEFQVYIAPVIIAARKKKKILTNLSLIQINQDYLFTTGEGENDV